MKLEDFINLLRKIEKERGGKVEVLIYDREFDYYDKVTRLVNPNDFVKEKDLPFGVRLDKSIVIC